MRPRQCGSRQVRCCLRNLISFEVLVIPVRAEGKAMDGVSLELSQVFDSVSHSTVLAKPTVLGLARVFFCWD